MRMESPWRHDFGFLPQNLNRMCFCCCKLLSLFHLSQCGMNALHFVVQGSFAFSHWGTGILHASQMWTLCCLQAFEHLSSLGLTLSTWVVGATDPCILEESPSPDGTCGAITNLSSWDFWALQFKSNKLQQKRSLKPSYSLILLNKV